MKRYAYKKDIFEVIQWTGENFKEVQEFVNNGSSKQSLKQFDDYIVLFKDLRGTKEARKGDYIIRDIEYGECFIEDKKLFMFIAEVEVKE